MSLSDWNKGLIVTNTLAYFAKASRARKGFYTMNVAYQSENSFRHLYQRVGPIVSVKHSSLFLPGPQVLTFGGQELLEWWKL